MHARRVALVPPLPRKQVWWAGCPAVGPAHGRLGISCGAAARQWRAPRQREADAPVCVSQRESPLSQGRLRSGPRFPASRLQPQAGAHGPALGKLLLTSRTTPQRRSTPGHVDIFTHSVLHKLTEKDRAAENSKNEHRHKIMMRE